MKAKLLLAAYILLLLNTSCFIFENITSPDERINGSGYIITESRTLPNFHSVNMSTSGKVYVTHGTKQEVSLTVDDNVVDYIVTSVNNGILFIGTKNGSQLSNFKLVVTLTMTDLEALIINSSGDIIGKNKFETDVVSLVINSSGDISLELKTDQLYSKISSSGDLYLNGSVVDQHATISSSGDLYAFNLITDITKITLNSSGDAEVYASRLLYVTLNSSGDLYYKGHPTIYKTISSSGRIIDAN